jgi:hypothetical protein
MPGPLTRPEPRRIVPRAVVDALIADADREISSLELQVERAVASADGAEARLAQLGIDERASAWATVQLERFVTELRAHAETESRAVVEEARAHARLLVADAEMKARSLDVAMFGREPEPEPERDAVFEHDEVAAVVEIAPPVDIPAPDPIPESASAPAEPDSVFREITPEALATDDPRAPLDAEFWPAEPSKRRRFPRARVVAAPTLAGLLVVAAVVVRLA